MSDAPLNGYMQPSDGATEYSAHAFVIKSIIGKLATTALVKVVAVTNNGGVSPVGFVDVQPMVNQMDGAGNPTPHATIHNMPYFRLQGGANAIIIDPVVGDIGAAVFCSRDISQVKRTKAIANPGSAARFDWSDGLYIGGFLNGVPTAFVQFMSNGNIQVTSPGQVSMTAPTIVLNGAVTVHGSVAATGSVTAVGNVVAGQGTGSQVELIDHLHSAAGGTGTSGPPVPGS